MLAVGLAGGDAMPAVLEALGAARGGDGAEHRTLTREFNALAARIAAQFRTSYLLGYCSPRRTGMHTVTVGVAGGTTMPVATYSFSAAGFGPGVLSGDLYGRRRRRPTSAAVSARRLRRPDESVQWDDAPVRA